ncbi:galactose mutarotase [Pseudomonas chlororaphis]|uniref:aldose epimerase family protein n=1 Tax=Pseudomonas chlororaphis TaxID=587753 RepID=UPI001E5F914A|nr:aldose epimerase family protein [Pseudomonas chlororaphis]MCB2255416.1 galactose mutarotase [Pseudomonas chlororaphis]
MSGRCEQQLFGHLDDGTPVHAYLLSNARGMQARVLAYGGILQALRVADRHGAFDDVVLGFDTLQDYRRHHRLYLGALIGRYANRLAGGRFELDGRCYQVPLNDGPNALHGGLGGLDKQLWTATPCAGPGHVGVRLCCRSPEGDMGFPGNVQVEVTYRLDDHDRLCLDYQAVTDRATVLNLTQHAYFNLAGAGNGNILAQVARLRAGHYLPLDRHLIPTGEPAPVAGTPLDLRQPTPVGRRLDVEHPQLRLGGWQQRGFNHYWLLDAEGDLARPAADLHDPHSGRRLELFTSERGGQFYTANAFDGSVRGKAGKRYPRWAGFALEAHGPPNGVNLPGWAGARLDPGQVYRQTTLFKFSTV